MDIITINNGAYIKEVGSRGFDIGFADPVSSTTLIRKEQFEEFSLPYLKRNIEDAKKYCESSPGLHLCGDSKELWPLLREAEIGNFSLDNCESLLDAKEILVDKMVMTGNVPPVDVMYLGSRKDVKNSVKKCIDEAFDSPCGYILSTGCQIPKGTKDEKSEIKNLCKASEHKLDRLDILVKNLLKIARLDAGMIVLEKSSENLSEMIEDIRINFSYRAKNEEKSLLISGDKDTNLICDKDWIMEAINNIVKNAFDHTEKGDFIKIEWEIFSSILQIKITDTGFGIHEEDIHHIFKRFYSSKYYKEKEGLGLGLALAKSIIESHGAMIEVSSKLNKGTSFIINFKNPTIL